MTSMLTSLGAPGPDLKHQGHSNHDVQLQQVVFFGCCFFSDRRMTMTDVGKKTLSFCEGCVLLKI